MPEPLTDLLISKTPRFTLGYLVATQGSLANIPHEEIQTAVSRHAIGEWGNLDDEDKAANDRALEDGTRLLSAYETKQNVRFWIITEADRSATTILLPEEY